jgi:tRNA(His) 5'-end guanylyltransferase
MLVYGSGDGSDGQPRGSMQMNECSFRLCFSESCPQVLTAEEIAQNVQKVAFKADLPSRMKGYEKDEILNPDLPWVVRLDGKNFSTFTKQHFQKPFDPRFQMAMIKTLNAMVQHFNPSTGFCCSDEITLIFPAREKQEDKEPSFREPIIHNGRITKIASLMAGKCSTLFMLEMLQVEDPDLREYAQNMVPCFDARVISLPSDVEVCNNIIWRSIYDCKRNIIAAYARHFLEGKTKNMHGDQLIQSMKEKSNFDFWEKVPREQIYGVFAKKRNVEKQVTDELYCTRKEIFNFTWVCKADASGVHLLLDSLFSKEDVCFSDMEIKEVSFY